VHWSVRGEENLKKAVTRERGGSDGKKEPMARQGWAMVQIGGGECSGAERWRFGQESGKICMRAKRQTHEDRRVEDDVEKGGADPIGPQVQRLSQQRNVEIRVQANGYACGRNPKQMRTVGLRTTWNREGRIRLVQRCRD